MRTCSFESKLNEASVLDQENVNQWVHDTSIDHATSLKCDETFCMSRKHLNKKFEFYIFLRHKLTETEIIPTRHFLWYNLIHLDCSQSSEIHKATVFKSSLRRSTGMTIFLVGSTVSWILARNPKKSLGNSALSRSSCCAIKGRLRSIALNYRRELALLNKSLVLLKTASREGWSLCVKV